ncbi:DUF308 domain-containing protein [Actinocrinis puniceicyclus]|uniref:DUF308 domain-containing protein n=1 Tax=Actinocrinis puniceicyclus TaxID=977794 RepID=A0A8J8BFU2_9ACTN|nr:DUF308 domain-containing protein [Actinocrinis puniceicyclus]MBS2966501.1 DUF308 domain-containing protein [Actinocrinis puniceicyclus]
MSEPLSGRVVGPDEGPGPEPGAARRPGLLSPKWARAWLVPVVFGVTSVLLGVLVLAWPGHGVGALTVLFGLYLLATGGYRLVAAVQLRGVDPIARVVALVLAVLAVAVGVVCLIDPFSTASSFAVVAGAFWFAAGAITWFGARQRRGRERAFGRSPGLAGGVFSMIVGLLIMLFPSASLVFLAVVLGCWLVFFGFSALATGLAARRLLKNVERAVLYWP